MEAVAGALVFAVVALDRVVGEADGAVAEWAVDALEELGQRLKSATPAEQDALAAAAEAALIAELAQSDPRPLFEYDYRHWMEHTFGPGWVGNRRVPAAE